MNTLAEVRDCGRFRVVSLLWVFALLIAISICSAGSAFAEIDAMNHDGHDTKDTTTAKTVDGQDLSNPIGGSDGQESDGSAFLVSEVKATSAVDSATLGELIELGMETNPRLKALHLNWQVVAERHAQATALDDPLFTYTRPIEEVETRLGPQENIFMVSQKLPFPGKRSLRGEIVTKDIEIAKVIYEKAVRDLRAKIKAAFYNLYYIDNAIRLTNENKAVLDYFRDVSRANYGINVSGLDELVRAQKLQAKASRDIIILNDMRDGALAVLNTLLDREPTYNMDTSLEESSIEAVKYRVIDELYSLARLNYEGLKIAGLRVEKSALKRQLSEYAYRPDFRVALNYSVIGEPPVASIDNAGRDAMSLSVGVNIPLWSKKNRSKVAEATLMRERSIVEARGELIELLNDIKRVYFEMTSARALVELYGESLVPEAKASLDFAEARYRSGEERLGRLLETQSMWLNFRLIYYRAVADYLKAVSELERLTGSELITSEES